MIDKPILNSPIIEYDELQTDYINRNNIIKVITGAEQMTANSGVINIFPDQSIGYDPGLFSISGVDINILTNGLYLITSSLWMNILGGTTNNRVWFQISKNGIALAQTINYLANGAQYATTNIVPTAVRLNAGDKIRAVYTLSGFTGTRPYINQGAGVPSATFLQVEKLGGVVSRLLNSLKLMFGGALYVA